jgi:hypothetical protein
MRMILVHTENLAVVRGVHLDGQKLVEMTGLRAGALTKMKSNVKLIGARVI